MLQTGYFLFFFNLAPENFSPQPFKIYYTAYTVDNQIVFFPNFTTQLLAFADILRRWGAGWVSYVYLISEPSTINLQNTEVVCTTSWQTGDLQPAQPSQCVHSVIRRAHMQQARMSDGIITPFHLLCISCNPIDITAHLPW